MKRKPRSILALKRYLRKMYRYLMTLRGPTLKDLGWWDSQTLQIEHIYQYMFNENILDWYTRQYNKKGG